MRCLCVAAALLASGFSLHSSAPGPEAAAIEAFYRKVESLKLSGLPNPQQLAALSPHLSRDLRSAIRRAQQEQSRCLQAYPGDVPPWVDGDLFSSNAEGFSSFAVHPASPQGRFAVHFRYEENGHRFEWQDAVAVRKEGGRWVINDVYFRQSIGYASGYGSSLRQSLAAPGCSSPRSK